MANPAPSIKLNLVANYASQIYVAIIGIVMAPIYLSYMGKEAYGLIGFFTIMTTWFQLLDLGLTLTLMRETARFRGGAITASALRSYLRVLEVVFGIASIIGAAVLIAFAHAIATRWLNVKQLPIEEVTQSVIFMALAVPLRWIAGLYRGVIGGLEAQVWLGGYNIFIATIRFVGVLAIFQFVGTTPFAFFGYQFIVAGIEVVGLVLSTYRRVQHGDGPRPPFSWKPLVGNLRFSMTIAVYSVIALIMSQVDRLFLSRVLPLSEFGIFSITVLAASAINAAVTPFGQALLPRLTKLVAEKDEKAVISLYGAATQAAAVLVTPAVAILVFFSFQIMLAWIGSTDIAARAAPIVALYAIGNGLIALGSFPYFLQYARGDLRLQFIGVVWMAIILVPGFYWAAHHYGGYGTGMIWACTYVAYTLLWLPLIHHRVFRGNHWRWLANDVIPIVAPTIALAWLLSRTIPFPHGRWPILAVATSIGVFLTLIASCGSSEIRGRAREWFQTRTARPG